MKRIAVLMAIILLALLPILTHSNYVLGVAVSGLLFLAAAAAFNLVYGYAGLLSFAQLGFWGVGAYCSAITVMDLGGSFWAGVLLAGVVNGLLSLAIGAVILRGNRHAFVVVTLTFALLCGLISRDWVGVTRGPMGIPGLPAPTAFGYVFGTTARFYHIALVFTLLSLGFLYALGTSRIGMTLNAIRQNEPLAQSQGVRPLPYKLAAFVIAAIITGMAGGIFAFHLKVVDPLIFDFYYMQTFLIIVIIGGAGSFWGVLVAGALMVGLPEALRFSNDLRMVIYGVILVLAMLCMPRGVAGWLDDRRVARMRAVAG
jgi:ABC-type branched-subunit amino acid transport system permease subunit